MNIPSMMTIEEFATDYKERTEFIETIGDFSQLSEENKVFILDLCEFLKQRRSKMSDQVKASSQSDIESRFGFHKPDADGVKKMTDVRKKVRELAFLIEAICPNTREKATALTQLSFVMMSANSAIVQQYPVDPADFS